MRADGQPGVILRLRIYTRCEGKVDDARALGDHGTQELRARHRPVVAWTRIAIARAGFGAVSVQPGEPLTKLGSLVLHPRNAAERVQRREEVGLLRIKVSEARGRGSKRRLTEPRVHRGVRELRLRRIGQPQPATDA